MHRTTRTEPKYPLLQCPKCGLRLRPTMHGWAFASTPATKCQPGIASVYAHPFEVITDKSSRKTT